VLLDCSRVRSKTGSQSKRNGQQKASHLCRVSTASESYRNGQLAGLQGNPKLRLKSKLFLKAVSPGKSESLFPYVAESGSSSAMTGVGLLGRRHSGCEANAPEMTGGSD